MEHQFFYPNHSTVDDEQIKEMKKILKKKFGREFSFEESLKAVEDMERLCMIVVEFEFK